MILPAARVALIRSVILRLRGILYRRMSPLARFADANKIPLMLEVIERKQCAGSWARGSFHCVECGAEAPNECELRNRA